MDHSRERKYQESRLRLIVPLLHIEDPSELRVTLARISQASGVSVSTLRRYLKRYRESGLSGLIPDYKGSGNVCRRFFDFDAALRRAVELRLNDPHLSVRNVIGILESERPEWQGLIKRSTLQRHLQSRHMTLGDFRRNEKNHGRKVFGRYRKAHRLDQVQCDVKEFPPCCVDDHGMARKVYLQLYSDNHSRKILAFSAEFSQDADIALDPLRTLLERYGRIAEILTDNGAIYRGSRFKRACQLTGIILKFCKPYAPEGKGMIERQNLALNALEHQVKPCRDLKLEAFRECVRLWIDRYNATSTDALGGKSPDEVFAADSKALDHIPQDIIKLAFKEQLFRKVGKDGSVNVGGKIYKADLDGIRQDHTVELLLDCNGGVEQILTVDGRFTAVPLMPYEIAENVDKAAFSTEEITPSVVTDPDMMVMLLREAARKNGTYRDEESFLRWAHEYLHQRSEPTDGNTPAGSTFLQLRQRLNQSDK